MSYELPSYRGPERRADLTPAARAHTLALDELDIGIVLLDQQGDVIHVNHIARAALDAQHPLAISGGRLLARQRPDGPPLQQALDSARRSGLRRMVALGHGGRRECVSIVPLHVGAHGDDAATMVMLTRRQLCEKLSVESFARCHRLTLAETRVLQALWEGVEPIAIAARNGVALSTVRTQINSIRNKTGATGVDHLVRMIAVLPPLVGALRLAPQPAPAVAHAPAALAA